MPISIISSEYILAYLLGIQDAVGRQDWGQARRQLVSITPRSQNDRDYYNTYLSIFQPVFLFAEGNVPAFESSMGEWLNGFSHSFDITGFLSTLRIIGNQCPDMQTLATWREESVRPFQAAIEQSGGDSLSATRGIDIIWYFAIGNREEAQTTISDWFKVLLRDIGPEFK
ncbi:hypothetical protein NQ176_g4120 [Zarea fungicola]|uniref:Uncharacterized protein n=1 Tax=Zarea fungicola TaxID=93591 RepID=A0ACC1NG41_9HYPO|nr:hypothetical protein NQ176_g4120 [Lecanicillium fungicola]